VGICHSGHLHGKRGGHLTRYRLLHGTLASGTGLLTPLVQTSRPHTKYIPGAWPCPTAICDQPDHPWRPQPNIEHCQSMQYCQRSVNSQVARGNGDAVRPGLPVGASIRATHSAACDCA